MYDVLNNEFSYYICFTLYVCFVEYLIKKFSITKSFEETFFGFFSFIKILIFKSTFPPLCACLYWNFLVYSRDLRIIREVKILLTLLFEHLVTNGHSKLNQWIILLDFTFNWSTGGIYNSIDCFLILCSVTLCKNEKPAST